MLCLNGSASCSGRGWAVTRRWRGERSSVSFCSLALQLFLSPVLLPTGFFSSGRVMPESFPMLLLRLSLPEAGAGGSAHWHLPFLLEVPTSIPRVRSHGVGDAGHLPGGSRVQTTHSFSGGHPADGNCWSLEWSQRAGDERRPGLLMNHSPLGHLGPLQHKLYLHLLKALGRFIEAAVLPLPAPWGDVTVNICLGGMRPADEGGLFCGQRDDSTLVTCSPC